AHDPSLLVSAPGHEGWFLEEGCAHLSVEAFWQQIDEAQAELRAPLSWWARLRAAVSTTSLRTRA
ncbi:MAG: hypothetical protein ABMA25_10995, partial [Ilumatobacteraceae bacterium]